MRLGPHRYHPGNVVGRWTVVRHASPAQETHGRDHTVWRHRVLVRCVCGFTDVVVERDLIRGRTVGCALKTCLHHHRHLADIARWKDIVAHAEEMRRIADAAAIVAEDARTRIADANERVEVLGVRLQARREWRARG